MEYGAGGLCFTTGGNTGAGKMRGVELPRQVAQWHFVVSFASLKYMQREVDRRVSVE